MQLSKYMSLRHPMVSLRHPMVSLRHPILKMVNGLRVTQPLITTLSTLVQRLLKSDESWHVKVSLAPSPSQLSTLHLLRCSAAAVPHPHTP
jgi:hypothetical protein